MNLSIQREMVRGSAPAHSRPVPMRQGEIFYAAVGRLFPNQHAEIRLGNQLLLARLEVPLESGKGYYFEVISGKPDIRLKLIGGEREDSLSVLKKLSLPNEKGLRSLADWIRQEPVGLTKNQMSQAGQWLNETNDKQHAFQVIKFMADNRLPFNVPVFHSLMATESSRSFTDTLLSLRTALKQEINPPPAAQKILALFQSLEDGAHPVQSSEPRFQRLIRQMGLFYEGALAKEPGKMDEWKSSLKPLLLDYLTSTAGKSSDARQPAEQLLYRMNGHQLLSLDSGPVQQVLFELPFILGGQFRNISFQWEGNRLKEGKVDPGFCRILFHLDLPKLKETVVDVHIQNRVMTIHVINKEKNLKELAEHLIPPLRQQLKKLKYDLSAVYFKEPGQNERMGKSAVHEGQPYSGVDIKI